MRNKQAVEIAGNLLMLNALTIEQIAEATKLPVETVRELADQKTA
ncbi:MAG: hypothetical protein Q4E57_08160 [Eubacteriales bacterium]|nr:hypothetical protein [Eubacteriales bacterium]